MNKLAFFMLACILLTSSQPTYARRVTCKEDLDCIIEKSEAILDNLHESEQRFDGGNRKLVRQLAKQCSSTFQRIQKMMGLLTMEIGFAPNAQSVKKNLLSTLDKNIENNKIYDGKTSLEGDDFNTKLYVVEYISPPKEKDLDVHSAERIRSHPLENEWPNITGQNKIQNWWFSRDSIFYAFEFSASPSKLRGLYILERPLDFHTITEDCQGQ